PAPSLARRPLDRHRHPPRQAARHLGVRPRGVATLRFLELGWTRKPAVPPLFRRPVMSKTNKIVSTAMAKLGDAGAKAKKAWNKADLAKKAGALVSAGAGAAAVKRGSSAAIKAVRKHPVGTAVGAAALAAVGAAVYAVNKRKKAAAAGGTAKKSTQVT